MLLNVVLMFFLCAVIGALAGRIMGGDGGVFHNAFVGFVGMIVADIVARLFGYTPGMLMAFVLYLGGACVAIAGINALKKRLYGNGNGGSGDGDGE